MMSSFDSYFNGEPDAFLQNVAPTYDRFIKLIEERFGCRLVYKAYNTQDDSSLVNIPAEYISLMRNNQPVRFNKTVYFPILLNNTLVGAAEAVECNTLSNRSLFELQDVLNLVLRSLIKSTEDFEKLRTWETQIHSMKEETNVISLSEERKNRDSRLFTESFPSRGATNNVPCLIEGKNSIEVYKLALEIHERSHRFAFLPWEDLGKSTQLDLESLKELGPVTLFIKEISELSQVEQKSLQLYLAEPLDPELPQITSATQFNRNELADEKAFSKELLQKLSTAYLKMNRPFAQYKSLGIVEILQEYEGYQSN